MKIQFYRILSLALALCLVATPQGTLFVSAQEGGHETGTPASLDQIVIQGNMLSLKTSSPAIFKVFKLSSPNRLVIDLDNTRNNWKKRSVTLKKGVFSKIRSAQFSTQPMVTRVVVELNEPVEYESGSEGNVIKLAVSGAGAPAAAAEASEPAAGVMESMAAAPTPAEAIEAAPVAAEPVPPAPMPTPIIPMEPEKPAAKIAATPAAVPAMTKAVEPEPEDKVMPLQTKKLKEVSSMPSDPSALFGKQLVTLDFYDIAVRELFKLLSEKAGVNIVFGNDVTGTVSIQLRDVTFTDAIETVLALTDLKMIAMGKNIVQVMTPVEFDKYRTSAISTTRLFPVNYAAATSVNTQLTTILAALGGKGKTLVDDRTNSIIVTDTPEGIEKTGKLILDLDKPAPQVMIESKIVQVSLGKSIDLGITWGVAYTDQSGNQMVSVGATGQPISEETTPGSGAAGLQNRTVLNPLGADLETRGTGFNPATGLGLSFGFVKDVVRLNAALSALQQKNKSKLLSNPKIATLNNQAATISSQVSEPYLTTQTQLTNAGTLSTQVVNQALSGISLTVTPTINADGRITMKIAPNITSSQPTSIGVPKTTSQTANTTVIVRDGETFVIGGLINEQEGDSKSYIPVLGSIPLLGHLFKKTTVSKTRAELLVFVTPKIIPY